MIANPKTTSGKKIKTMKTLGLAENLRVGSSILLFSTNKQLYI